MNSSQLKTFLLSSDSSLYPWKERAIYADGVELLQSDGSRPRIQTLSERARNELEILERISIERQAWRVRIVGAKPTDRAIYTLSLDDGVTKTPVRLVSVQAKGDWWVMIVEEQSSGV